MVLEGPFLNGTRLLVDQILLLGCWYLPTTLSPCLLSELLPVSYCVDAVVKLKHLVYNFECPCHAQLLAVTNRVTEQLSWLTVESFFMSCLISWMASLIDDLMLWI